MVSTHFTADAWIQDYHGPYFKDGEIECIEVLHEGKHVICLVKLLSLRGWDGQNGSLHATKVPAAKG